MGWMDLFGGNEPSARRIEKAVKALRETHGDPARRMGAADKLRSWGTPEALRGLMQRFTTQVPSTTLDQDEKTEVAQMLQEMGETARPVVVEFLAREPDVHWPLLVLERTLSTEEYVGHVLATLEQFDSGFARVPAHKADLVSALSEVRDPRIAPAISEFLTDFHDEVRLAAVETLLANPDEEQRDTLIAALLDSGDRPRVLHRMAEALGELGWSVSGHRKAVEEALGEGYAITREGRLQPRGGR